MNKQSNSTVLFCFHFSVDFCSAGQCLRPAVPSMKTNSTVYYLNNQSKSSTCVMLFCNTLSDIFNLIAQFHFCIILINWRYHPSIFFQCRQIASKCTFQSRTSCNSHLIKFPFTNWELKIFKILFYINTLVFKILSVMGSFMVCAIFLQTFSPGIFHYT